MREEERDYEAEMKLPAGYVCDDCSHFRYCTQLIGKVAGNTKCDWAPARFRLAIIVPKPISIPGLRPTAFTRLIRDRGQLWEVPTPAVRSLNDFTRDVVRGLSTLFKEGG